LELVTLISIICLKWIVDSIFFFFVTIIPTNNRSIEESYTVVKEGYIKNITANIAKFNFVEITDEEIERAANLTIITRMFFKNKIRNRFAAIKKYFLSNPDIEQNETNLTKFWVENHLNPSLLEILTNNLYHLHFILKYIVLIIIIYIHPEW
jgi:hypothetical protein